MSGSSMLACTTVADGGTYCQQPGSYGALGVAAAANVPSGRSDAASWIDSNGNLWLFGGQNYDPALLDDGSYQIYNSGFLNDLWEFSPTTQQWTWVGGGSGENQSGVYGTLGMAAAANFPGSRSGAASWTDRSGNFWLFGGEGYDANYGESGFLNDLWKYNPTTGQWTWVGGSSTLGNTSSACRPGIYGTLGSGATGNIPGGRADALGWTDQSGNRWLFGGMGCDAAGNFGALNDLWQFNASTQAWVWMSGSSTMTREDASGDYGRNGVYGSLGQAAQNNVPGGRYEGTIWIDASGNLWIFGGQGYDSTGTLGFLNDLWEFNPSSKQWIWMGGSSSVPSATGGVGGQPGVYGALGVTAASNVPGGRSGASNWTDGSGIFWLLGGGGRDSNNSYGGLNDLWEFNPSTSAWTWMAGGDTVLQPGVYGTLGVPSDVNVPGGRSAASSWNDTSGNIWIFGGQGYDAAQTFGMLNDLWVEGATAPAPTFMPPPGTYKGTEYVSISDAEASATIYYTTDGTPPTPSSTPYTGPVKLTWSSETLQAIAVAPGLLPSTAAVATYMLNGPTSTPAATPVFSPGGGTFAKTQAVTISDATPGAAIYYTTDESTPTTSSNLYAGPITVSTTNTLKAIAVEAGYLNSAMATATYTILPGTTTLTITGSNPYSMTCLVSVPVLPSVTGPTGKVTFTDSSMGQTLGTVTLGAATIARSFQAAATYKAGDVPTGIAFGDFNGDGKLDLVITNNADASVSILLNNGDGTFHPQVVYAVFKGPLGVSVGDFNGDGKLDLAVANGSNGTVSVLLGNGDGTFQKQTTYSSASYPRGIVVGDFNGDGKLDIAATNSTANELSILLGNGNGTFQAHKLSVLGGNPQGIVTGFFAGNQQPLDLVVANNSASTLSVLAGNGDGTFQSQSVISNEVGTYPTSIATADFNGDGNLDLAITSRNLVTVLLGNGDGTFQYSPALAVSVSPVNPVSIAAGDFNGDGIPDLAVTDGNSSSVLILTGNGDGTFQVGSSYAVGSGPIGMVAADLNGDGNLDLATVNSKADTVSVLLGFQAALTSPTLANVSVNVGTLPGHALHCSYSGDANYPASTSNMVSESYPQVATPVFSLLAGDYPAAQQVSISDATAGAVLYYTSDGSTPTTNSTKYTGPIAVSSAVKLKAIASLFGYAQSAIAEVTYEIAAAPSFASSSSAVRLVSGAGGPGARLMVRSPRWEERPGVSSAPQTVTISDQTPGATIYYTTDGTTPSTNSATYTAPISVAKTTTVHAFATAAGYVNSPVTAATYTVTQASAPTVALATSASTIPYQASITFTATVAGSGATPTGTVAFLDGATQLGASALSAAGAATLTVNALSVGTHSIQASYAGDSDFSAATSTAVSITVNPAAQTIAFVPLAAAVTYGAGPLALKASASSGLAVVFTATGLAIVSSGNLAFTGTGTVVVTASQSGNGNYAAAAPVSQTVTVNKATPSVALTASANSAAAGSTVTLTATVTGSGAVPGGTLTFYSGATALGTATLNGSGAASYTTAKLAAGKNSITANYGGDGNYAAATSPAISVAGNEVAQTITFGPPTSPITYGASPLTLNASASSGLAVVFTATGPATISGGKLALTGAGTVVVTASQSGNDTYAEASPVSQTITVNKATPSAVLKASSNSGFFGAGLLGSAITFTVTVTGTGAVPSGTVTFYSGTTALATAKLDGSGAASYTTSKLGVGKRSITASYGGNANYTATASAALTVTLSNIGHINLPFRFGGRF
jgi:N-acetylneuraminic acid mutarotase